MCEVEFECFAMGVSGSIETVPRCADDPEFCGVPGVCDVLVEQERDAGAVQGVSERSRALEEVVIAFADEEWGQFLECAQQFDTCWEVGQLLVDEVSGEGDEVRGEMGGGVDDAFENLSAGESADV